MAAPKIFISMGTPYTAEHASFRDALETFLRDSCHADPRIIGKNEYPAGAPLTKIRDVMRQCHGVMIVAYERKYLQSGIEKRGGSEPKALSDKLYTTPWNHIESAMAFSLGKPLYILCQRGLAEEGLIESKIDWFVQYVDISKDAFATSNVGDSIRNWIRERVIPASRRTNRLIAALQGNISFAEASPKELRSAATTLFVAFGAGVVAALALGERLAPVQAALLNYLKKLLPGG